MAKANVDLKANPPKSIPNLTKDAMLHYVKTYGTMEDKKWYVELCQNNMVEKFNQLTKKTITTPDISILRQEFAKRFFPSLLAEKETKSKTQSYMEKVLALLDE